MAPISSPRRLAVIGLKGGTGKTTLAVAMATTYARARGENILLFDADTRQGSLPLRTGVVPVASAHDLAVAGDPGRIEILAGSLARSFDGVWVLPSGRTAEESARMDQRVYTDAMNAVYRHFPIMITDCGAGVATPLMQRVLSGTHGLVLATTATADGVLTTESAVDWLHRMGYGELTKRSIVVLTNVYPKGAGLTLEEVQRRFASSCAAVLSIPADRHLGVGSYLDLDALAPATRAACTALAGAALRAALST
ncbi:MAG: MinD/ParA family protein [Actinomycetota bacterium]|nr:MinD/ParA family protein [Actinomycetota bacterium]